jgi:hypothetical protein
MLALRAVSVKRCVASCMSIGAQWWFEPKRERARVTGEAPR